MPPDVQCVLTSATLPEDVLHITERFMRDPVTILVKKEAVTLEGIEQFYVALDREEHKLSALCDLYETLSITQCIIFVNTRRKADWLYDQMTARDFTVSAIHGDLTGAGIGGLSS